MTTTAKQNKRIEQYRAAQMKVTRISGEELFELRANFDEDYVVNAITGQRIYIRGPKAGKVEISG
jgi:hypothetical protein